MVKFMALSQGIVVSFVTISVACFVFFRGKRNVINKWFIIFNFTIGLWCLGPVLINLVSSYTTAILIQRVCYCFGVLLIPSFIHFVYAIREEQDRKQVRTLIYIVTLFLLIFLPTPLFIKKLVNVKGTNLLQSSPGPIYYVFFVTFTLGVAYCLYMLFRAVKHFKGNRRNAIKFILIAYGISYCGGGVYFSTIFKILNIFTPAGWIVSLGVLILFYAIIKHHLMDIRVAITRWTIFSIVYAVLLVLPIIIAVSGESYFEEILGSKWWIGLFIAGIILTYLAHITYQFIRDRAEGKLLKEQRRYQTSLLDASKDIILTHNEKDLYRLVVSVLTENIGISHVRIFTYNREKKKYRQIACKGLERRIQTGKILDIKHSLIKLLKKSKKAILAEDISKLNYNSHIINLNEVEKELRAIGGTLIVPNIIKNHLLGFISLGGKKNQELYTVDDINVLSTLGNQVALAMENAEFYRKLREQETTLIQTTKLSTLGEMAAGFAHQINNPIAGIILTAGTFRIKINNMLNEFKKDKNLTVKKLQKIIEDSFETLKIIENRADHVGKIVTSIMRFTKADTLQETDITEIVEDGINMIPVIKFKKYNVKIKKQYQDNLPKVHTRPIDIEQIIMNLCNNAIEAMHNGGKLSLNIYTAENSPDYVNIDISDTGIGIPKKNLDKIFDFFFTTKGAQGLGLGLALVYKMVTSNNGSINVASKVGEGTTFKIKLPVYKKSDNDIKETEKEEIDMHTI
ncbi:ATP-binding protein [bacterium]